VERAGSEADYTARRFPRAKARLALMDGGRSPRLNQQEKSQPQAVSEFLREGWSPDGRDAGFPRIARDLRWLGERERVEPGPASAGRAHLESVKFGHT
jgi:hypothetical protein